MGSSAVKFKIANAEKTRNCNLEKCGLRNIPDQLQCVAEYLSSLDLSHNKIDDLAELKRFLKLRHLKASHNRLMQVPDIELIHLRKLHSFILDHNILYYLPPVFANMSSLVEVNLANNRFQVFPVELCLLPKLEILDISSNTILKLPKLINKIQAIEINLNQNNLTDLSSEQLAKCSRLRVLRLEDNDLSIDNFLPDFLEKSQVSFLTINGNNFEETEFSKLPGYFDYHGRYMSAKESLFTAKSPTAVENAKMKDTVTENERKENERKENGGKENEEEEETEMMKKPERTISRNSNLCANIFTPGSRTIVPWPFFTVEDIQKSTPVPSFPLPRNALRQLLWMK